MAAKLLTDNNPQFFFLPFSWEICFALQFVRFLCISFQFAASIYSYLLEIQVHHFVIHSICIPWKNAWNSHKIVQHIFDIHRYEFLLSLVASAGFRYFGDLIHCMTENSVVQQIRKEWKTSRWNHGACCVWWRWSNGGWPSVSSEKNVRCSIWGSSKAPGFVFCFWSLQFY